MQIKLWIFPEQDFPAWQKLVGSPEVQAYPEYLAMIAAIQADQERAGREVLRVGMRVASMESRLAKLNLPNTPDNRAQVIAEHPPMHSLREWQFDFGIYSPDGRDVTELECDELLEVIINWAESRGLAVGGGFGPMEKEE